MYTSKDSLTCGVSVTKTPRKALAVEASKSASRITDATDSAVAIVTSSRTTSSTDRMRCTEEACGRECHDDGDGESWTGAASLAEDSARRSAPVSMNGETTEPTLASNVNVNVSARSATLEPVTNWKLTVSPLLLA